MNQELTSFHKRMSIVFSFALVIVLGGCIWALTAGQLDAVESAGVVASSTLAVLGHFFGMLGARRGTRWGRMLSRMVGIIYLLGFPVWTIVGIYVLRRTGAAWQSAASPVRALTKPHG